MNSLQIKYFLAVARCESFSRAAEELYIAQPTLSKCISSLEKELDVTLFHRAYRKVTLTMDGKRYYDFFYRMEKEFRALNADIHPVKKEKISLRVAILEEMRLPRLNKSIWEFRNDNADVDMSLSFVSVDQILDQFEQGKYDVMIVLELMHGLDEKYFYTALEEIPMMLYYNSRNHENPDINTFKDDVYLYVPHIQDQDESFSIFMQNSLWDMLGYEPKMQKAVESFAALQMAMECGMGYCVLAQTSMITYSKDIASVELDFSTNLIVVYKDKKFSPILNRLLDIYRHNLALEE